MTTAIASPQPTFASVARAAGIGIGVAIAINVVLYFIATSAGWLPALTSMGTEITLLPVLLFSIGPSIIGALIYFALTRFVKPVARANHTFAIIASIALIVMAATPLGLAAPQFGNVMILEIMHLAVGLPVMYFLTKHS
ncbi:hypothetical protein GC175_24415 [bacterium]|nr:hypothetical protein [bacterium]